MQTYDVAIHACVWCPPDRPRRFRHLQRFFLSLFSRLAEEPQLNAVVHVLDNGSSPDAVALIEQYRPWLGRVKLSSRNVGINEGYERLLAPIPEAPYLMFFDSDVEVIKPLSAYLKVLEENENIGAATGQHSPEHGQVGGLDHGGHHWILKRYERGAHLAFRGQQLYDMRPFPRDQNTNWDWHVVQWADCSVEKLGKQIAVLPGGVRHLGWQGEDTTWKGAAHQEHHGLFLNQSGKGSGAICAGTIPVYINNRNRLTSTRAMAQWFDDVPGTRPIIIDNASTYKPLLDWYDNECPYSVIRLDANHGHHAPWDCGAVLWGETQRALFGSDWYAVTDSDLSLDGCPKDLIEQCIAGYSHAHAVKIGLSLRIDDLPDTQMGRKAQSWEAKFWQHPLNEDYYRADIDTTFAVYPAAQSHGACKGIGPALRTAPPYMARHLPWYLDKENLPEEERYYFEHTNGSTTWTLRDE